MPSPAKRTMNVPEPNSAFAPRPAPSPPDELAKSAAALDPALRREDG